MKKLFLTSFIFVGLNVSWSQSSFTIISAGDSYTASQLEEALNNADMCGFYFENTKRTLLFDDGSIVELNSTSSDPNLDVSCSVPNQNGTNNEYWEISANGHLVRRLQTLGK